MKLIPVKYHNKNYPDAIVPLLNEVAGNLDSKQILTHMPYSLHTEYSYMKRNLNSDLLSDLDELRDSHKNRIPQLWKSMKWSEQYAIFIMRLIGDSIAPEVIEIHPPFKDYCRNVESFWERYMVFFNIISAKYPETKIIIENRCGTMYIGAPFIFSTCNDVLQLCQFLSTTNHELGVIVDYPQLFSAEKIKMDNIRLDKILQFNENLKPYAKIVDAIHLWGKKKSKDSNRWSAHSGDLNTFFSNDVEKKRNFIDSMKNTYCDEKARYFIPEVNTSENDLKNIVNDLLNAGITFVKKIFNNYLLAIDWENKIPQFVLCHKFQKSIRKFDAIGSFSITVGGKKYCIGNKDIINHEYIGCPNRAEINSKVLKCSACDYNDKLKYCVRCTGKQCFVKDKDVLLRCNHRHFVYLAFFPNNLVKVGVSHERRKYSRLLEQGALYSYIIASCQSGKIARQIESDIRGLGIKDKVTSTNKIHNMKSFDINHADEILSQVYNSIIEKIDNIDYGEFQLIRPPEKYVQKEIHSIIAKVLKKNTYQLTLWSLIDDWTIEDNTIEILNSITAFCGQIVAFIGSIAILKEENQYYLYDFKQLYGREIYIHRIS